MSAIIQHAQYAQAWRLTHVIVCTSFFTIFSACTWRERNVAYNFLSTHITVLQTKSEKMNKRKFETKKRIGFNCAMEVKLSTSSVWWCRSMANVHATEVAKNRQQWKNWNKIDSKSNQKSAMQGFTHLFIRNFWMNELIGTNFDDSQLFELISRAENFSNENLLVTGEA